MKHAVTPLAVKLQEDNGSMAQVRYIIGDCPSCGAVASFGNVYLPGGRFLLRGCKVCEYNARIELPPLRKKILYLDQFVFSNAFRNGDRRLTEVVQRVTQLQGLQLLAAPYSTVHEDETHQWRGYDKMTHTQLMAFIKEAARGIQYKPTWKVKSHQLVKGFRAFLENAPPEYTLDLQDAIEGEVHAYDDYFRIQINRPYLDDIEKIRTAKQRACQLLFDAFDGWRTSTTSFEEDVKLEIAQKGGLYLNSYLMAMVKAGLGDLDALIDGSEVVYLVRKMLHMAPARMSPGEKLSAAKAFFESQHFALLPSEWLAARIFATLKRQVRDGAYSNKDRAVSKLAGFFYDVQHISTYAPYCDAFFMDDAMRDLVNRPTVGLTGRFGTRVFSLKNLDEFIQRLDSIENSMTAEHLSALALAYPHWIGLRTSVDGSSSAEAFQI